MVAATAAAGPIATAAPDDGAGRSDRAASSTSGDGTWVSAWSASPQGPSTLGGSGFETLSGATQLGALQKVVPPLTTFDDETVRQVMYLHHGGRAVRIRLSNEFGTSDTTFPSVTIGTRAGDSGARTRETPLPVTFDGQRSVTVPRGGTVLSDPVPLTTEALDHVVVSMHVPGGQGPATVHGNAMQTFFTAPGDRTGSAGDDAFAERGLVTDPVSSTLTTATYYATGIQVEGDDGDRTLVAFGDSITDGVLSEGNTDGRYPDVLARRLKEDPETDNVSVISQAVGGGRLTADGFGPSGVSRVEREILDQPNLGGVLLQHGINDLGQSDADGPTTADDLIAAYRDIAERVHARGVPIYIGTLTPAGDRARPAPYGLYSGPVAVAERRRTNEWIRGEGREVFDGVVDFDAALRDPRAPDRLAPQYNSFDNLHPNQDGYRTMAESVPQEYLREVAGG